MKVLSIGESLLEITCSVDENIADGSKLFLTEKQESGGGHAGNVAYLLGKWGVETHIASMVGADDAANKIKKEYESIGVNTDYMETSFDRSTTLRLVLTNKTTKINTVFHVNNNSNLKKYSFLIEPDIIFSDGNDFNATVSAIDKFPKAKSVLMISRNNNEMAELCRYVDYVIFNKKSAEDFTGVTCNYNDTSTLVNVYNKLKQKYNKPEIVITLGEKGCIYSLNGQIKIVPPIKADLVDSYGAGDSFAGAFVYGIGREFEYEKTVVFAVIASSLSITKVTSRLSIPSLTEVSNYFDSKFGVPPEEAARRAAQAQVEQQAQPQVQAQPTVENTSQPDAANMNTNGN